MGVRGIDWLDCIQANRGKRSSQEESLWWGLDYWGDLNLLPEMDVGPMRYEVFPADQWEDDTQQENENHKGSRGLFLEHDYPRVPYLQEQSWGISKSRNCQREQNHISECVGFSVRFLSILSQIYSKVREFMKMSEIILRFNYFSF